MERIQIGVITKPQGIKGEVKIKAMTDDISRFLELKKVYIDEETVKVLSARVSGSDVFLSLDKIADRNAAEALKFKGVFVDRQDAVPLEDDRYFIVDIIGCEVVSDEKKSYGKVVDILQYGSADIYVLSTKIMFPYVDGVAIDMDIINKVITVSESRFQEVAVYED